MNIKAESTEQTNNVCSASLKVEEIHIKLVIILVTSAGN